MVKTPARVLMWCAILLVLLFTLLTPLALVTGSLMLLPILMIGMLLPIYTAAIVIFGFCLFLFLFGTGIAIPFILITIFFAIPALLMVMQYKKGADAKTAIGTGIITILLILLSILLMIHFSGVNISQQLRIEFQRSLDMIPPEMTAGVSEDFSELVITYFLRTVPYMLILISFYFVCFSHTIARRLLNRNGFKVPQMAPIKNWRLPRYFVWIYVVVLLADMMISPESKTFMATLVWNVAPLLMTAFAVQAISFLSYVAQFKRWGKVLPIIGVLMLPIVPQLVSLLGIFDIAFPLRHRFKGS